jgi:exopolysaccharide biosynthesis polyprenyl glycosylphosphotransferase
MDLLFRKILLLITDAMLLYVSLGLTILIGFWGQFNGALYLSHAAPFSFLYLIWLVLFYTFDLYDLSVPVTSAPFLRRWMFALVLLLGSGMAFFYIVPVTGIAPKTNLVIHVFLFWCLAYVARRLFLKHRTAWKIGLGELSAQDTQEIERVIHAYRHQGYTCVRLQLNEGQFAQMIRESKVRVVILPRSFFLQPVRLSQVYQCLGTGVVFLDLPGAFELFARRIPVKSIDEQWFLQHLQVSAQTSYRFFKRIIDLCGAVLLLALTFPIWFAIAIAIKLEDGGPVIYTQKRVGQHGTPFSILKFRTMRTDAELYGAQWASKMDSRVTRVGDILRRTHLDELPQMINVLKGELSLVGPRPERPEFVHKLETEIPHYHARHFIKPGFTGWAQIKFRYARSVLDSQKKFEYDLYYMKNRSLILDVLILLKTVQLIFRREH